MKRVLSFFLIAALAVCLCACGGGQPEEVSYIATQEDAAQLAAAYSGRTVFHGEAHDHADTGGTSDGEQPLSVWKNMMVGLDMDFAVIVDHKQSLHMYLEDWDNAIFIGGSEAATTITDRPEGSNKFHYNMIFADPKGLENVVTTFTEFKFREWTEQDREGCGGQMHFNYPQMNTARFNELITAVKENGGMFVIPHPCSTNETVPKNSMEMYFQDYIGFEVFYGCRMEDSNNWKTEENYKLWVDLLSKGARIWATAGNDDHRFPQTKCLSTVYSEEGNAFCHMEHLRVGDFTAGPVGVKMCIGDTLMGSTGSFEDKRVVFSVGDFHKEVGIEKYTFIVKLLTDKGEVFTYEMKGNESLTFAVDADETVRFYRVEVFNKSLNKLTALGNPIWNEAKYQ